MSAMTPTPISTEARAALRDILAIGRQARGDHPALAEVRRHVAIEIDKHTATMVDLGIDVDALLDELDAELDAEEAAAS